MPENNYIFSFIYVFCSFCKVLFTLTYLVEQFFWQQIISAFVWLKVFISLSLKKKKNSKVKIELGWQFLPALYQYPPIIFWLRELVKINLWYSHFYVCLSIYYASFSLMLYNFYFWSLEVWLWCVLMCFSLCLSCLGFVDYLGSADL